MAITAGALTQLSVGSNDAKLQSAAATGATGTVTYQWYRSTTSGFVPGGGNIIAGATSLILNDSGLIPNNVYYYVVRATDSFGPTTDDSAELAVTTTAQQLSQNVFQQSSIVGQLDQHFNYNTTSVQVDSSQATPLYAGSAVKLVDSAGGVPKVVGCAANADEVYGFLNYDIKSKSFGANMAAEMSGDGNVMYLYATGPIARGEQVTLDVAEAPGSVAEASGGSGFTIVGWAMDKAAFAGALIRVRLKVPAFAVA